MCMYIVHTHNANVYPPHHQVHIHVFVRMMMTANLLETAAVQGSSGPTTTEHTCE